MKNSELTVILFGKVGSRILQKNIDELEYLSIPHFIFLTDEEDESNSNVHVENVYSAGGQPRVSILNMIVHKVSTPWIFYLDADEVIDWNSLLELNTELKKSYSVTIKTKQEAHSVFSQSQEIRLFPRPEESCFTGHTLPYASQMLQNENWTCEQSNLIIQKISELYSISILDNEYVLTEDKEWAFLLNAMNRAGNGRYKEAEYFFRRALKGDRLLQADRLAALNGLADALWEQHRFAEADETADLSLQLTCTQRMPYLVLYRISHYKGNSEAAYQYLSKYLKYAEVPSMAHFDVSTPVEECHNLLMQLASENGDYSKTLFHLEHLYKLNGGNLDEKWLEKLLVLSIELEQYEKSVTYFNALFCPLEPQQFTTRKRSMMYEMLSFFNEKNWHHFTCNVYEKLFHQQQQDDQLLNRWVATLTKSGEISKARQLIREYHSAVSIRGL